MGQFEEIIEMEDVSRACLRHPLKRWANLVGCLISGIFA
jgi:hypothetical protein